MGASIRVGRGPVVLAALLVLATATLSLMYTRQRAGVWLSAPLDDTFIHFQYARQLARGRPLQFNDGDSRTTGASSPLYLVLLAPGWLIGFRGLKLLGWAWLVNGGLHLLGGLAIFSMVVRLTRRRPLAYTALCAFLLNGPLLWGVYSQMEVALFSTLILLTLHEVLRLDDQQETDGPVPRRLLILGALLALTRPEGMVMAGGLSIWLLWRHLGSGAAGSPLRRLLEGRRLAIPIGAGVALVLLYLALTGRVATNAAVKSHLQHISSEPGRYLSTTFNWLPMTVQILLEKWPRVVEPLTTTLSLAGLAFWTASGRLRRPGAGALVLGWLLLLTLFYALLLARRDHHDRYYLPYWGLTVVAVWWALGALADRLGKLAQGTVVVAAMLVAFTLPQTRAWAARFGDNCRDLAWQHFRVAESIERETPPETRIAVNDAGAIPYLTGRYTYDVVGLVHNAFYGHRMQTPREQTAAVWETLESLSARPSYMVAYPEWIPDLHRLLLFKEVKRFPLKQRTIVANDTKVVWRLRWDRVLDADRPPPPAAGAPPKVVDMLDTVDRRSEAAHDHASLDEDRGSEVVRQQLVGGGRQAMIDGGREVHAGEAFTLRCHPGRPAILLVRLFGTAPLDVDVSASGRPLGRWRSQPRSAAGFSEVPLLIPGRDINADRVRITLRARAPYTPFHYWLMQ